MQNDFGEGLGLLPQPAIPVKGWSVGRDLIVGDSNNQVALQASFDAGDYTVQFNLDVPSAVQSKADADGIIIRAEALISWSVQGNNVYRRVNVAKGVAVSGNGEGVNVTITDVSFDTNATPENLGGLYRVSATITRGTRPTTGQPPTLMAPLDSNSVQYALGTAGLPGDSVYIPIPANSGVISTLITVAGGSGTPIPNGGVLVQQIVGTPPGPNFSLASYDPRDFGWTPVIAGCSGIQITNVSALPTIICQIVFGIQG